MDERDRRIQWLELEMGFQWLQKRKCFASTQVEWEYGDRKSPDLIMPITLEYMDAWESYGDFQKAIWQWIKNLRDKKWSSDPPPQT